MLYKADQSKQENEIVTVCMNCQNVKDQQGRWQISLNTLNFESVEVSHGLCPNCAKELYPEFYPG